MINLRARFGLELAVVEANWRDFIKLLLVSLNPGIPIGLPNLGDYCVLGDLKKSRYPKSLGGL